MGLFLSQKLGSCCDSCQRGSPTDACFDTLFYTLQPRCFSLRHVDGFGSPDDIRQELSRLVEASEIRRLRRRLYDLPRQHPIIGQTALDTIATVRKLMEGSYAQWQSARRVRRREARPPPLGTRAAPIPTFLRLSPLVWCFRELIKTRENLSPLRPTIPP